MSPPQIAPQTTTGTPPPSPRVPLQRKIILKFQHFDGFSIEASRNISLTGMFIRTDSPEPPGAVFMFEVWVGDDYQLVHGVGEVVWERRRADGPNRPPGMGVRFLKLDPDSRRVISGLVEHQLRAGAEAETLMVPTGESAAAGAPGLEVLRFEEPPALEPQPPLALAAPPPATVPPPAAAGAGDGSPAASPAESATEPPPATGARPLAWLGLWLMVAVATLALLLVIV